MSGPFCSGASFTSAKLGFSREHDLEDGLRTKAPALSGRTVLVPGKLSLVVSRGSLSVTQLCKKSEKATHCLPAGTTTVATEVDERFECQKEAVTARPMAGNSFQRTHFMDIVATRRSPAAF